MLVVTLLKNTMQQQSGKRKRNLEGSDNEDYEGKQQFMDATRRRIADLPRARPGDISPLAMTTVTCLHAAVAQKSYGISMSVVRPLNPRVSIYRWRFRARFHLHMNPALLQLFLPSERGHLSNQPLSRLYLNHRRRRRKLVMFQLALWTVVPSHSSIESTLRR